MEYYELRNEELLIATRKPSLLESFHFKSTGAYLIRLIFALISYSIAAKENNYEVTTIFLHSIKLEKE